MNSLLNIGRTIKSTRGIVYNVISMLGSGGQGEVYKVCSNNKEYALKWYYAKSATEEQKENIINLIEKGKPDDNFLWPLDLVESGKNFGYIMDLRGPEYKSIVDLMKRRAEPSFRNLCKATYNLARSYYNLHVLGYSYRDISFGNMFFNPDNGEVLICDNDNVSVDGYGACSVFGTPRFMAPEIVIGAGKPSRNTDLYSLSVLLFYMLMLNHPLEGKAEAGIKCLDVGAMNKLYGTEPVFIFNPTDKSNRPVLGYQDNAIVYWDLYPTKLKSLFTKAFTTGLSQPQKRVTENEWSSVFAEMLGEIIVCEHCGAENFFCNSKAENGVMHTCWSCQKSISTPIAISIDKHNVFLYKETKLYRHHLYNDYDMSTKVAEVSANPKKPSQYGIKNLCTNNWTCTKLNGEQITIVPGQSVAIVKGIEINFGNTKGKIN